MQTLKRVDMTEAERRILEQAVAAVGEILSRFEAANGNNNRASVSVAIMREPDYEAEYPWPIKTFTRFSIDIPHGRRCSAATLHEALEELFAKTDAERALEQAAKYRAEAERLEKEAAKMAAEDGPSAGSGQEEGGGRRTEDGASEAQPATGDQRGERGAE